MPWSLHLFRPSLLISLSLFALTDVAAGINGCSAKGAVSLTGSLGNVSVTAKEDPLVTTLSGNFDVYLELGERASDATNVSFSAFSLVSAETGAPVLAREHLSVVASRELPVRIQPGDNTTIRFQIGDQAQPGGPVTAMEVDKSDYGSLCNAGSVKIVGTMQDSLNGQGSTALSSAPFTPDC